MKVAFLDRDGTINRDYADQEWPNIKEPELIAGAVNAMKHLISHGFQLIIVTNQYIIHEGIISTHDYFIFTDHLLNKLRIGGVEILDIFYCPHKRSENCGCCKPKVGLIQQACEKYPDIDLAQSLMVGDSIADRDCAKRMNFSFFGINVDCDHRIDRLYDLTQIIK